MIWAHDSAENNAMTNPFDILARTPKNNCGECGYPTCLAFAAAVSRGGESPEKCPYVDLKGLDISNDRQRQLDSQPEEHDYKLVKQLKEKVLNLNLAEIAAALGATWDCSRSALCFPYLNQPVELTQIGLQINGNRPEDPRDQILLYNYVHSLGGNAPTNDWVGLESLPNSISKIKTLATYCEIPLAEIFADTPIEALQTLCTVTLNGTLTEGSSATLAAVIPVLPRIPQYLLVWEAEPEDGFDARVKILFDRSVLDFLDLESLVFSAERLAERCIATLQAQQNIPS